MTDALELRRNRFFESLSGENVFSPAWWQSATADDRLAALQRYDELSAIAFGRGPLCLVGADLEKDVLGIFDVAARKISISNEALRSSTFETAHRAITELCFRVFEVDVVRNRAAHSDIDEALVNDFASNLQKRGGDRAIYTVYNLADSAVKSDPRRQHYLFAHAMLPQRFFRAKPFMDFLYPFYSGEGKKFLLEGWHAAGEGLTDQQLIEPEGLDVKVFKVRDDGLMLIAISLPAAHYYAEAQYIGLVFFGASSYAEGSEYNPPKRYFAVERTFDPQTGEPSLVLGEWVEENNKLAHRNVGNPRDMETFEQFIDFMYDLLAPPKREGPA